MYKVFKINKEDFKILTVKDSKKTEDNRKRIKLETV